MDLPEHLERERDGRDGANQHERPPDGLALALGQAVRQQKAEPDADRVPTSSASSGRVSERSLIAVISSVQMIQKYSLSPLAKVPAGERPELPSDGPC